MTQYLKFTLKYNRKKREKKKQMKQREQSLDDEILKFTVLSAFIDA